MLKNFIIKELVPPETFEKYGIDSIRLFDPKLIETIEFIRERLNKLMTINTWAWGGEFKYRGYRPENCTVGAVKSAHREGMAVDFDVKGMMAEDVRKWLNDNEDLLPYPIRCEADVNWVHIDTRAKSGYKVYFFKH